MFGAPLIVLALMGQPAEPPRDPAALLEKLGSAAQAEREAVKSLESLGARALPALRTASKSKDPEVRKPALALIQKIEGNLLIQGSLVRLDFQDASLGEIFKSLSKQVGFDVGLAQGSNRAESRRITLREPQPVPLWKAIDRLCEVGKLTYQNQIGLVRAQNASIPRLALVDQPPTSPPQPVYGHGPFRFNLVSLSYQSQVSYTASAGTRPRLRNLAQGLEGAAPKGVNPPVAPVPAQVREPAEPKSERAAITPFRTSQLRVQVQLIPEPRMAVSQASALQLVEALDDLGQSLLPTASPAEGRPAGAMSNFLPISLQGSMANLIVQLHRPETPGKLIKTLRGTVEVAVSAVRPNPLVIPLEKAAGKTFQNEDRHVVVNSIQADPGRRQQVIELTIDDLDELFPPELEFGGGRSPLRKAQVLAPRFGNDPSLMPIQVLTQTRQYVYGQTSLDRNAHRVTLRLNQLPQMEEAKEIRIANPIRATAKVPFEFHDLPMP